MRILTTHLLYEPKEVEDMIVKKLISQLQKFKPSQQVVVDSAERDEGDFDIFEEKGTVYIITDEEH